MIFIFSFILFFISLKGNNFFDSEAVLKVLAIIAILILLWYTTHIGNMGFTQRNDRSFFIFFVGALILNTVFKTYNLENYVLRYFVNIVFYYSVISLILWLLGPMANVIKSSGTAIIGWGGVHSVPSYFGIFFPSQGIINFLSLNLVRNTGIFAEAPMYAYILSMALLIDVLILKKIDFKSVVIGITIFTTTSTTGVIMAALVFGFFITKFLCNSKYRILLAPIGLMITVVVFYLVTVILNSKNNLGASSVSIRMDDIKAGYLTWRQHPFIGSGYSNNYAIIQNMLAFRQTITEYDAVGFSSGMMKLLAGTGTIFTVLYYILPLALYIIINLKKDFSKTILSIFILALLFFSIVQESYVLIFIIALMWVEILQFGHRRRKGL